VVKEKWYLSLRDRLQRHVVSALSTRGPALPSEEELRRELLRLVEELCRLEAKSLESEYQESLIEEVLAEVYGFGPIDPLMRDQQISDILINGPRQVFIEKGGQLQPTKISFRDDSHLMEVVQRMLAGTNRRLDEKSPLLDARLLEGSRLNAVIKPAALNGPLISIRRLGMRPLIADDLLANESLTKEMLDFLASCVRCRLSMIISGGTGSGKTTLLNALSRFIPSTERVVTIEDTAELELQQPHVAKLESQPADLKGDGEVTMRDLVRNSLRMRPDRIIIGECRGPEALEMLQAMNTGHEGSLTTVHANSGREALDRVDLMISVSGLDIPTMAIRKLVASSVSFIVQVARLPGGKRKVMSISEVAGMDGDLVLIHDLFQFVQTGIDKSLAAEGYFRATGIRPQCLKKMIVRGANLPPELFMERRLKPGKPGSQADGSRQ
jgi:pilus assembly protein CpaF